MPNLPFIFEGEPVAVLALKPNADEYSVIIPLDRPDYVTQQTDEILTQYRESDNLLAVIREKLEQVDIGTLVAENVTGFFDLDFASHHQLTIIGGWLGWPRYHKYGARRAVFGFTKNCDVCYDGPPLAGFCYGVWDGCEGTEFGPYTFTDDNLYRRFLNSKILQLYGDYQRETLKEAIDILFNSNSQILYESPARIAVSIGRPFREDERATLHLYRQVMPLAPGIELILFNQIEGDTHFGFGLGWQGFCQGKFF